MVTVNGELMEIRRITSEYAVAPQLEPNDMATVAAEGFVAVINNRPDEEVPVELQSGPMREAAEAAGLQYIENPVINNGTTPEMVARQFEAAESPQGPVLAWCRTGTRSATVWALGQAGRRPTAEIMKSLARAGYVIPALAREINRLAAR